ncbi:sigma-54 factor interaction domain-containing protein [Gemmatirosa kalamazoonensis]|uniref:Sigma-54 factor interaction domain-containing protein n=1 Tax=Gemmatirosa kalamazoonensis TaxID=861299 RepID=W0RB99_9BACT|nr:sigma-54 dependent transcriptional regulator [Gemmatirosa kalamazoonensis]AHG87712.1 sigma-54 factor interaction domain-containing protein [Gemmatirosa kalamazoonensis]
MATILYVDDEPAVGLIVEETLRRAGHETLGARHVPEALHLLERNAVDLIVSDYRMPGITGLEFLSMLQREGYDVPVIMLTGYASIEHAVASIKAGAIDYITKPVRPQQLELAVDQALEYVRLRRENETLKREVMEIRSERQIVGDSSAIRKILQTVKTAAPTRAPILLQGESGVGKELFARAVHEQSDRRDRPFIALNCAALPEGLIESALFGHEKGAFTGAIKRVEGAFERAHRGTLLLDEISEMRLDLQAKLLRVLQEQEFERVGGTAPIKVDVRIIATTNRDLADEVRGGRFRQDLFYRLSVIPMQIPALRERAEDIPLLAYRFAMRTAEEMGKKLEGIAPETLEMLQRYPWPGNVRELQHVVERAVILTPDPVLPPHALEAERFGLTHAIAGGRGAGSAPWSPTAHPAEGNGGPAADDPMRVVLTSLDVNDAEKVLIARALQVADNNRTRAAELLGMSVRTLRNKLNNPSEAAP